MGLTFDTSEVDRALAKLLAQDTTPIVAAGADVVGRTLARGRAGQVWQPTGWNLRPDGIANRG